MATLQSITGWTGIGALAALMLLAAAVAGCSGGSDRTAPASEVASTAPSALWFAHPDGSIVAPEAGQVLAPDRFVTRPAAGGRQVAYDATHDRLWYSDDHSHIFSIELATGAPGPALGPFSDVALWGCSVSGRARTFAVDEARGRLLVSALGGGLLAYDLDSLELTDGIGPSQLREVAFDFRRLAIDGPAGTLWYSTASGAVMEWDLEREVPTGRQIDLSMTPRSIAVDGGAGTLLAIVEDGLVAVDLGSLSTRDEPEPTDAVALTWVAAR